jgi:hypothetical protein
MVLRRFQISAKRFWGYRCEVDIDEGSTFSNIVEVIHRSLVLFLEDANFLILADEAKACKLHLHNSLEEMLLESSADTIFYACDHEHCMT